MSIGLRQAAQQALNALDEATTYTGSPWWSPSMTDECIAAASALRTAIQQAEAQQPTEQDEQEADGLPPIVAGAIFDFAGFMTTRSEVIEVGSTAEAGPVADLVKEWAESRGLDLANAAVLSWQLHITRASLPATPEPVARSEREQLRHAQAAVVMPMIGPLLDAWENSDREVMSQEPELSKQLKNINSAMEGADIHPTPSVFLVRDVASLLGASVPDVCNALAELGYEPRRSTNAAISPDEALAVAKRINPAPSVPDALVRDAERYRWLAGYCRSTSEHWGGRWSIIIDGPAPKTHDSEDDLDAAIDAAMLAAKEAP